MVKADDSWPHEQLSAWNSPNLKYMNTPLQYGQQNGFPSFGDSGKYSSTLASLGLDVSGFPGTGQTTGAQGSLPCLPTQLESLFSTRCSFLKEKHSASSFGLEAKAIPNPVSGSTQRRFLIFDQCGNQIRLILTPVCTAAQNPIIGPTKPICTCDLHDEKHAANVEVKSPFKPIALEKSIENQLLDGREMHEDTDEINALLYSDEDEDEDDDVTSTGCSPLAVEGNCEYIQEMIEEIASSDGPTKRQRLLDGAYKKSSLMDIAISAKLDRSWEYDDDAESSCANGRTKEEDVDSATGNKQSRKDNIYDTLRIFESIIPGIKTEDPLLIIDEAIKYLKSLKLKARALAI